MEIPTPLKYQEITEHSKIPRFLLGLESENRLIHFFSDIAYKRTDETDYEISLDKYKGKHYFCIAI